MQQLFKTSGIAIDDLNVKITKHPDGSMLFGDYFIPEIKLKDIISGAVIIDPSVLVQVEIADWTINHATTLYEVNVPHQYGLIGTQKARVLVVTMNLDYEQIIMDTVQIKENVAFITSTQKINMYVAIKRI